MSWVIELISQHVATITQRWDGHVSTCFRMVYHIITQGLASNVMVTNLFQEKVSGGEFLAIFFVYYYPKRS